MRRLLILGLLVGLSACADPPAPATDVVRPAVQVPAPDTWDDIRVGPPPRIGYVLDHRFVTPGGRRHPLPRRTGVLSVTRLGDGFLVQDDRNFESYTGIAVVRRGVVREEWSTSGTPAVGLGGLVAWGESTTSEAWPQPPPKIRLEVEGVRRTQVVRRHPLVAGVIDGQVVYTARFLDHPNMAGRITDLVSDPRVLAVSYVTDVDEVNSRLLASVGGGAPMVMRLDNLTPLWDPRGRGFELELFSPGGGLVLARGRNDLVVLDSATGEERGRITLPEGVSVAQTMWETERTILIVVERGREMAVLRAMRSGRTVEFAVPPMRLTRSWIGPGIVLVERR
jgi:hypothetical protein